MKRVSFVLRAAGALLLLACLLSPGALLPARAVAPQPPGERVLFRAAVPAAGAAQSAALAPAHFHSVDTRVQSAAPNASYSDALELMVGSDSYDEMRGVLRSFLRFSVVSLPPNATITRAELKLTVCGWYDYQGANHTVRLLRVATSWHPGVASWSRQPGTAELLGQVTIGTPDTPVEVTFNLLPQVQGWYNGTLPNYGLMLAGQEGSGVYRLFCSNETTEPPRLEIDYTAAPPRMAASATALKLIRRPGTSSAAQVFTLRNTGSERVTWQVGAGAPAWLALSRTSGVLGPGGMQVLTATGTPPGSSTYTGTLTLTSSTSGVPALSLPVTLYGGGSSLFAPVVFNDGTPPVKAFAALVIGISHYQDIDADLNAAPPLDLPFRIRSGEWPSPIFLTDEDSEGVRMSFADASSTPTRQIQVLENAQATRDNILRGLEWLDSVEDENTIVAIYYSAHGGQITDTNDDEADGMDEALVPYDTHENATTHQFENLILDDTFKAYLDNLESSRVAVILDTCHSGGMNAAPPAGFAAAPDAPLDAELAAPGRVVLTASRENQFSTETSALQHGVFTYYLLEAFANPAVDTNGNGWISAQEAFAYVDPRVNDYMELHGGQDPQIINLGAGEVDLVVRP